MRKVAASLGAILWGTLGAAPVWAQTLLPPIDIPAPAPAPAPAVTIDLDQLGGPFGKGFEPPSAIEVIHTSGLTPWIVTAVVVILILTFFFLQSSLAQLVRSMSPIPAGRANTAR